MKLHGRTVHSVFELMGSKEPALTAALGFTLDKSPRLRARLLEHLELDGRSADVGLEVRGFDGSDRTDVEIFGDHYVIVEAKRGWTVPNISQLRLYARRQPDVLCVISNCTTDYARFLQLPEAVDAIPVKHVSWREVLEWAREAKGAGQRWIREFRTYLEANVATLQDIESNQVYCVSLGKPQGLSGEVHTSEYLEQDLYFHPRVKGWPQHPPTYLGFRYYGHLQSIRHVDAYELVTDLGAVVDVPKGSDQDAVARPHVVYRLGPHIGPAHPLPAGKNYQSARHWIFIDLLLTSATYQKALELSAQRKPQNEV